MRANPHDTVDSLFRAQVAATPQEPAITADGVTLSYTDLDARASAVAAALRRRGFGPETPIGLCAERSVAMMAGLLGIIRAGCAYVPLDPDYPVDRLAFMLTDTAAPVVLTHDGLMNGNGAGVPVLDIDSLPPGEAPPSPADPDNLVYVIYTSGSTGRPKGVLVPHRGVVNRLLWHQRVRPIGPGTTILQKTPISFDVSAWELFWPLVSGARLVLARPGGHRDPAYLAQIIAAERVDIVHFVPSMLAQFVTEPAVANLDCVSDVFCTGEALPPDLADRAAKLMSAQVHNMYGPTETSIEVSAHTWQPGSDGTSVPIGDPIDNVTWYVLDDNFEPVPAGTEGELYIGGVAVTRGYHRRADLTADRFLPDPFAGGGHRMYCTGDVVRALPGGQLDYLGRVDHQVKINGNRIELGEISAVLRGHPAVADAVVVTHSENQHTRLVAYVVGTGDRPLPGRDELESWLSRDLPAYMLPAMYLPLAHIPLTTSGKVDRAALPVPMLTRADLRSPYSPPENPTQWTLTAVWSEVLGLAELGIDDDFFALGGDSISALQIIVRTRDAGLQTTAAQILGLRTVRRLADEVVPTTGAPAVAGHVEDPALAELRNRADIADAYPLTSMQAGMLFHSELSEDSGDYHQQTVIDAVAPVDDEALTAALQDLVDTHPVLRSRVQLEGVADPTQVVLRRFALPVRKIDWRDRPDAERPALFAAFLREDRLASFDLVSAPPVRATLIDFGAHTRLVLSHHHLILDAWSLATLTEQLGVAYAARRAGRRAEIHGVPYRRLTDWLRAQDRGPTEDFWRAYLAGLTEPTAWEVHGSGHDTATDGTIGEVTMDVDGPLLARLRAASRNAGLTASTLAHGFWALLLVVYSGQDEVVFGSTVAGRPADLPAVEDMVGLFINTIPVRACYHGSDTLAGWLNDLQTDLVRMRDHAHAALPDIQAVSDMPRGTPLFDTIVIAQNQPGTGPAAHAAGLRLAETYERTGYPLILMVEEQPDRIRFLLRHQLRAVQPETARRIADHLRTVAEAFAEEPGRLLRDTSVLSRAEHDRLLSINDTVVPGPDDATIHGLFEEQVRRTPNAAALLWGEKTMTYRELNARANRLARHLKGIGVGPESLVGVIVERSPELLVTLLAVLKAQAAYVPLAPDNPAARVRTIMADAGLSHVVSQDQYQTLLTDPPGQVCLLDRDAELIAEQDDTDPPGARHADQLAYVIYTSGSTGRPKGVACHHRGLVNYLRFCADRYTGGRDGGTALFSSVGFDMIVPNLYTPLLLGRPVRLLPEGLDPAQLAAELVRGGPYSFLKMTPGHLELLTQQLTAAEAAGLAGVLAVGADAFPSSALRRWRSLAPDSDILNEYGPTEASVANSVYTPVGDPVDRDLLPIGSPIPHTTMYVLDRNLAPAPVGVPGEIYIGGVCPARGYLHQPGLTAERFLPDPYTGRPGMRMYRTGDRGYQLPDGNVQFQRRLDDQVKIRGYRVETGEIEQHLATHPGVERAIVLARSDQQNRRQLVAYVVGSGTGTDDAGGVPGAGELREFLGRLLPGYLIPSLFVAIDAVPLDANGKVERRALPAPDLVAEPADRGYDAPRDEVEVRVAAIWAAALGLDRVGVHDNYFELGGDSILTIQIMAAARAEGLEITPRLIFRYPTVATLAAHTEPVATASDAAGAEAGDIGGTLPPTPMQAWFLNCDLADAHHYNQSVLLETEIEDPTVIAEALRAVVNRHPALRARFTRTDAGWQQHIEPPGDADLLIHESIADDEELSAVADRVQASLDLTRGPLLRAALVTRRDRPANLIVVVHHLAVDTVSWRFLVEDLAAACDTDGQDAALPATEVHPGVWAAALKRRADDPTVLALCDRLTVPTGTALPGDPDAGSDLVGAASTVRAELGVKDTRLLLSGAPAARHVQVEDVLLTALARALRDWAGGSVRVDVERHGRDHPLPGIDISRTVGWFTSVVPFAPSIDGDDLGAALDTVKEHLRSMPHGGFDHALLRHLSTSPQADRLRAEQDAEVVFNYHGRVTPPSATGPLRMLAPVCGADRAPGQRRTHPIEIEAEIREDRLLVDWTYPPERLAESSVVTVAERFLDHVNELVRYCVAHPGGHTSSDFPLARLTDDEVRLITSGPGVVEDVYPLTTTQAGMLFQTLLRPDEGVYIDQQNLRLTGAVDLALFERAWREAAGRHAILRTTVDWQSGQEPVQVVWREPELFIRTVDDAAGVAVAERSTGMTLDRVLWKLVLSRSEDAVTGILTYHHLLLDGWSVDLLLRDVMAVYTALLEGRPARLEPATAFRQYVGWLGTLDAVESGRYWATQLHDVTEPTPMPVPAPQAERRGSDYVTLSLTDEQTRTVRAYARGHGLTLASVATAAWATALGHLTDRDDVLFGCTVSGRTAAFPGADRVVGPMLNTLPVRVRLDAGMAVPAWLDDVQAQMVRMQEHENAPLSEVQECTGIPRGVPLFHSIVVTETLSPTVCTGRATLTVAGAVESTEYPLVVNVVDADRLRLELLYDRRWYDAPAAATVAHTFLEVLRALCAGDAETLGEIMVGSMPMPMSIANGQG
ncbi:amino acid adenylation domain-containing protein [Micromonospora sp. NPDC049801]|uniref:amino acid adenylation domain-containing protein n=1 Tax=unclassified Micromonospora TaxID=2617518 RepID=UPI0033D254F8